VQSRLFYLITLVLPDPEPVLRIVDSNYDVKFGGVAYLRFPVKFTPAEMTSDGSISKTNITIANVSREIMYYVEQYNGLRGCRVVVKSVYANVLDELYPIQEDGSVVSEPNPAANETAFIEDEYYVDTYSANDTTVVFQLDPIIDMEVRLPRRRYLVDSCYWKYGDPDTCKCDRVVYPGLCGKTFADCKARGNEANFGGFPGVNSSRRIFL